MSESRILRYEVPVDDRAHYHSLGSGEILLVACRQGPAVVEFWIPDTDGPKTKREFVVVGTGHPYPSHWQYRGSTLAADGMLVWHLMEVPS
jgi:hypothetical protein